MRATVAQMVERVGELAPWELAEEWDNVGLLCGHPDWPVEKVLVALDLTEKTLDQAQGLGVQLIVTHHPILFAGARTLCEDDPEAALIARLIRARIALICAHTNFDNAPRGLNDALADAIGLRGIEPLEHGLRIGEYDGKLNALAARVQDRLGDVVRVYGNKDRVVRRVAVCGGSGGQYWRVALDARADAYLTGEIKYHDALNARACGMAILEAGHRATEAVSLKALKGDLQTRINEVQYSVMVFDETEAGRA